MPLPAPRPRRRRDAAAGFTLVELMISLALVLLLTVAMARIFGVTARAISKGTAVGEVVRGLDATRTALQLDFTGAEAGVAYDPYRDVKGILPLSRQPAIIISSKSYNTFLDAADRKADSDGNPATIDTNNDGVDDATLTNYQTGRRWFRGDRLSFFAGGDYKSQTNGNANAFVSNVSAPEAWVWYGHGRVYNGGGDINSSTQYKDPGKGDPTASGNANIYNPDNYYASDWILLRSAILLKAPVDHDGTTNQDTVVDADNNPILHMDLNQHSNPYPWSVSNPRDPARLGQTTNATTPANVAPLEYNNGVYIFPVAQYQQTGPAAVNVRQAYSASVNYAIQHSRVDVAGVTAAAFREHLDAIQQYLDSANKAVYNQNWYQGAARSWYSQLFTTEAASGASTGLGWANSEGRFWVNPRLVKPLDAGETSQASGLLLPGCTQFVVEYAGDFFGQNADASINTATAPNGGFAPDGVIDFNVDANGVRHVRWYGLPRDVDGDVAVGGTTYRIPGPAGSANAARLQTYDVVPLADYTGAPDNMYPFEKRLPGPINNMGPSGRGNLTDYGTYGVGSPTSAGNGNAATPGNASLTNNADGTYVVVWGPGDFDGTAYQAGGPYAGFAGYKFGPSLIRVVVTGIDRQQKLEEPITQELVFRVPAQ